MTYMISVIAIVIIGFLYLYFTHRSERRDQMKHELDMRKAAGDALIGALSGVDRSREGEVIELMRRALGMEESEVDGEENGNSPHVSAKDLEAARLARYEEISRMAELQACSGNHIPPEYLVRLYAEANKPTEGVLPQQLPVAEARTRVRAKLDDDHNGSNNPESDLDAAPREAPEKSNAARSG